MRTEIITHRWRGGILHLHRKCTERNISILKETVGNGQSVGEFAHRELIYIDWEGVVARQVRHTVVRKGDGHGDKLGRLACVGSRIDDNGRVRAHCKDERRIKMTHYLSLEARCPSQ